VIAAKAGRRPQASELLGLSRQPVLQLRAACDPEGMAAPIRPEEPQYRHAPCRICGASVEVHRLEEGAGSARLPRP
jgi:hypothetical protein